MSAPWRAAGALLALLLLAGAGLQVGEAWDRLRADTAVTASAVGEPGCLTGARFTGPDGVERTVDVRVYKGNCRVGDPGDPITVYYDAEDPGTTAASRSWWWPGASALVLAGIAWVLARAAVGAGRRPGRDGPRGPVGTRAEPASPSPPPARPAPIARSRPLLDPGRDDAALTFGYALGRVEVMLDAVDEERARVETERPSGAPDAVLDAARRHLEAIRRCLRGSAVSAAEVHAAGLSRVVLDQMSADSTLARNLVGLRRDLFS